MNTGARTESSERGFIMLVAMVATLIPLFLLIGATTSSMMSRQSRLRGEVERERCFAAAESGVDACIYLASTPAGLSPGTTTYTRDLGNGMSYTVETVYLKTDAFDNDGDGATNEADENMYKVTSTGMYRGQRRKLVAYLGPVPQVASVTGALTVETASDIDVQGLARIIGTDTNMNGTAGPASALPGVSVEPPLASFTTVMSAAVTDAGTDARILGSPPYAQGPPFDWNANKTMIQNSATHVLTSDSYHNWGGPTFTYGNGPNGDWKIIYRNGDVQFNGPNSRGAGILYVEGNLVAHHGFRFDGIVYVKGTVQLQEDATICGALFCHTGTNLLMQGHARVTYSSQAVSGASAVLPGKYVAFNGWQETSPN